jgi:carbonic anhydrase/acetyltransferase-like protein (isoleucine patch superfamily)
MPDDLAAGRNAAFTMQGPIYALDGVVPKLGAGAWVAPNAAVIGDVEIGENSSVWFNCVLRGDTNIIRVGARTNIQDGSILHVNAGDYPCIVGDDVTIGHAAIVHACILESGSFVAMGATVLDKAVIEHRGMLAAGAVLTPGKRIRPYELWAGTPAKLMRKMSEAEWKELAAIAPHYAANATRFARGLRPAG